MLETINESKLKAEQTQLTTGILSWCYELRSIGGLTALSSLCFVLEKHRHRIRDWISFCWHSRADKDPLPSCSSDVHSHLLVSLCSTGGKWLTVFDAAMIMWDTVKMKSENVCVVFLLALVQTSVRSQQTAFTLSLCVNNTCSDAKKSTAVSLQDKQWNRQKLSVSSALLCYSSRKSWWDFWLQ